MASSHPGVNAHNIAASNGSQRSAYVPILDCVRLAAITMVVGIHCLADLAAKTPQVSDDPTQLGAAIRGALTISVPLFIMISGALNLRPRALERGDLPFLKARFTRLVPATVVWTLFYQLVMVNTVLEQPTGKGELVGGFFTANQYPHLYFLWLIMGLYLVTPILGPYVQRSAAHAWVVALGFSLWGFIAFATPIVTATVAEKTVPTIEPSIATFALLYVGHYLLGYAVVARPPGRKASAALVVIGVGLLAAMATIQIDGSLLTGGWRIFQVSYQSPLVVGAGLTLFAGLYGLLRDWRVKERTQNVLRALGNASFGVFLFHFVPLYFLRDMVKYFSTITLESQLALWVVVLAVSWIVALAAARIPFVRAVF